jgi:hypothetical protein
MTSARMTGCRRLSTAPSRNSLGRQQLTGASDPFRVHRRADGHDPPRGRREAGPGAGEEARGQRPDDLRVAQAFPSRSRMPGRVAYWNKRLKPFATGEVFREHGLTPHSVVIELSLATRATL